MKIALEESCDTALPCPKCAGKDFRLFMETDEATNEISQTLVNNVECSECHGLFQVQLVRSAA